ncbi:bifunctional demethylmenaquinone methyltransferase/2-methoxy-6-polyprenyl-1,4-benzoquinol methylase UbiE [Aetokthonos hydrillicola Thurmond2011]|jgi:demethylmenaquinone methyltransferase/2-methoxy-6-polyprenyl-1,4-benzoquinol methylase|uniref:2-phytyl-1,4-naphtoquinone methyltransferase n=1 Tax=Aetokthonos hydrillicola Thurmond2011 TaxID=2712845 RepID=A0AAP5M657_9CYAN|nr:bifunctional demethylmenaquinone methyltransferase/2-methoxy-6-polyprenyl-1,4-benzoquinol methylase UbiE [Aetokthonos hydrillicola]MBO3457858.1 bifunctional demethylmenaquinone methyltransferase/2-methoxy-6-polyprenyl-1,4-benzoquinol methylase UbiE [Aetokthonos hydrillicola CCALA 1050]MBW4587344.1 bifunctional demethylmenaquinone methyltransferase/2-methoxy-6-polyprenyl-1,4-benzoquinol methylase UbiE [Aetokthonos hydrillicola CCALA 1050]MDR9896631.1 bifunctional demethylmenaquinone methyltran
MTNNEIRAIFDSIAPVYDQLNDWLSLGQHRIWKEMTIKWSGAKTGDTSLDLCCGSGDLSLRLARRVGATGRVYGVDFSTALLEIASARAQSEYLPPVITWVEADVLDLPFENNYFDAVTMGYGLRNVTDIPRSLKEIHRVLKASAKAAILDFHRPSNQQIRALQQWYMNHLVVPLAEQMGFKEEYAYISPSLDRFPIGTEQVRIARQVGFVTATHYPIANGMMGVLVVTKA